MSLSCKAKKKYVEGMETTVFANLTNEYYAPTPMNFVAFFEFFCCEPPRFAYILEVKTLISLWESNTEAENEHHLSSMKDIHYKYTV